MFFFRRSRVANEEPTPPCSVCASTSSGAENVRGDTTDIACCLACQNSGSSTSIGTVPAYCAICEQPDGPFPKVSPWRDSVEPPTICISCIEQSSSTANTGERPTNDFRTGSLQAEARGGALKDMPCVACGRSLPASVFPSGYVVESCRHEPEVCLDCIENAIMESLDNNLAQCIGCPQCGDAMSAVDVWRYSRTDTFQR